MKMKYKKINKPLIAFAVILTVLLCTATVQAAEYFTTDGGVSVIPVFANTGAADTAMGTPVQGALIYSTSDGGIMYYDGSAWVSIESLADGTATNNTLRWNGSNWVESTALTNDGTDVVASGNITATGDVAVNGGDITTTSTTANIANATATTVNIAGAGTTVEIGAATGTTSVNNSLTVDGNTTIGNASGDMVTANAAAWTFASDTAVTLSGGVDGLNIDSDTLSVDATNDRIGIGTAAPAVTLDISSATDALDLPEGTTAQRPGTPAVGMIRYNSTTNAFEGYGGSTPAWGSLGDFWEDGTNGVFEDDEAVIVGADAAFTHVTSAGTGDLRVADDFEAVDDGFIGGDMVVGASTSATETLSNTGFTLGGDDLFVAGVAGVEGNIYTDGSIFAEGDLAVDGGDITSDQTTFNLLNATPTTVNIAGAATTVEVGAATGATSVNNDLAVDGNTTLGNASGDTLTANADAWTFANDTAITLSGGVDGLNIDSDTLSVDATNDRIGIGTAAPAVTLDISSATDALDLPEGTTAQRPGTPAVGMIRYNSTTNAFEGYGGSTPAWGSLGDFWEDGANGVFEDDEAVIVGADAVFTHVTSAGTGDLRVADDFEAVDDGFIGGDMVVGASTSATETLSNTGFTLGGDDLFVAGLLGVEGNIYTDGDVDIAGGDLTTANTTATLFNTNATTVNIAGAANTIEIGANAGTTSINNNLTVDGNTTLGNLAFDTVTANAALWTFANDTFVTLSGGVNGLNFDTNTLSIDATNDRIGIGTAAPGVTLDISTATDALDIPEGTTAQRPGTPAVGMIRYNSTTNAFEGYSGSSPAWVSLANALWEDGANGVYEDDEAVIVGADAAFTYTTSAVGNLKIANNIEAGNTGFIGGDMVVGAKTSILETLSNAGFGFSSNGDLFVAQRLGVEGNIYTDGDVDIAGGDITNIAGALTVTPQGGDNLNVTLSGAGDMVVNTDDLVVDTSEGRVGIGTNTFTDAHADTVLEAEGIITSDRTFQAGVQAAVGNGDFTVTFNNAFDAVPTVVATSTETVGNEHPIVNIVNVTAAGFTFHVHNHAGVAFGNGINVHWMAMARTQ